MLAGKLNEPATWNDDADTFGPQRGDGDLLAELQSMGVRLEGDSLGSSVRKGGAGPSDHMAVSVGKSTIMVPVLSDNARSSPYRLRVITHDTGASRTVVERGARVVAEGAARKSPRFYELSTKEGVPYHKIALLHSTNVLASTVLQTCYRYTDSSNACQFCAIGDSLRGGRTLARKTPEQLAEVARAAARLDGIENVVLTTGTPSTPDRGAAYLAMCARAIKDAVPLPVQVQCEPPDDFTWFERLHDAGADALGLHLEAVEPEVRARVLPGKSEVPLSFYFEAFRAAVKVFGRGNVSTYLIAGLGDSHASLVQMAARLTGLGVYPFVVPFVPLRGTPMAAHPPPESSFMQALYRDVGRLIQAAGMTAEGTLAGCTKCGACSALSAYESPTA